jgi:hypothetical protein
MTRPAALVRRQCSLLHFGRIHLHLTSHLLSLPSRFLHLSSHHITLITHLLSHTSLHSSLTFHRSSLLSPLSSVLSSLNSLPSLTYRIPSQDLGTTCTCVKTVKGGEKHEKKGMKVRGLPFYTSTYICLVYIAKVTH